jgi:quercetin dioxygenase-like cupin family protein
MERKPVSDDWEPGARDLDHRRITVVSRGIESLVAALPISVGRARRRQVLKAKGVRILRLSFDAGQVLTERAESAPMLIQTLQGRVTLTVDGEQVDMPAGAIIHLERQIPHSIAAAVASHVMVTLLGPKIAKPRAESYASARATLSGEVNYREPARVSRSQAPVLPVPHLTAVSAPQEWAKQNSVLAATGANAEAFDDVTHRHAEILGELATRTAALLDRLASDAAFADLVAEIVDWVRDIVLPYLKLEAEIFYPAVALRPQQRPFIAALEEQLMRIVEAADRLAETGSAAKFDAASAAIALRVIIGRHLTTEAEALLPTLAISTDEPLAALWARVNENLSVPLGV